jgi:nucleotide-binding universal stress UspA family protein
MVVIKNILVATDFSEPSGVALAYGRDLARTYNARLHVLHVVEDMLLRHAPEIGAFSGDFQAEIEARASDQLQGLVTDDDRRTLNAVAVVDRGINPADTIVKYARHRSIDLIVTGTHGRGAVKHFFMGSVAERVVRTASCPTLTVHTNERDFIVPDALTLAASV